MRPFNISRGSRRGTVTVIVVAFLGLLFILALTFVFYSIAESDAAKVYRDGTNGGHTGVAPSTYEGAPPEPETLINQSLSNLIYGVQDGLPGAFNVLRGHDLARSMYGWNVDPSRFMDSTQAFNGIGRVKASTIYPQFGPGGTFPVGIQPFTENMVNFSWQRNVIELNGLMYEIDNNYARDPKTGAPGAPANYRYYAKNANYTYPDENNLFLAAIDPTSGRILVPSFHRPWLMKNFGTGLVQGPPVNSPSGINAVPPTPVANDNDPWTNAYGSLLTLRPRPVDHQWPPRSGQSEFTYPIVNPDGTYGDLANMEGKSINQPTDSIWLDLDFPVRTWQGKSYKPLVAFLILDLDGRINISTAGNFLPVPVAPPPSTQYAHYSNQGVGPWEVNPSRVMRIYPPLPAAPGDDTVGGATMSRGRPTPLSAAQVAHGRFGGDGKPNRRYRSFPNDPLYNMPSPGTGASFNGQVDYSAYSPFPTVQQYSDPALVRGQTGLVWGQPFIGTTPPHRGLADPYRPDGRSSYDNGIFVLGPPSYDERTGHPSMLNPYLVPGRSWANKAGAPDRVFGVDELRILSAKYNYGDYSSSELAAMPSGGFPLPAPFANNQYQPGQLNARFATTPISNDLGLPGAAPWLSAMSSTNLGLNYQPIDPNHPYPIGSAQPLNPTPGTAAAPNPVLGMGNPNPPDHDAYYRASLALLGPVDINRKLTDYRARIDQPLSPTNIGNIARAVKDRQQLAKDIFDRLRYVTTGEPPTINPTTAGPGTPRYNALRYLAQLAVNIVDYLDDDDCITTFKWTDPNGTGVIPPNESIAGLPAYQAEVRANWVFGFERPRLTMIEMHIRYANRPDDVNGVPDPFDATKRISDPNLPQLAQYPSPEMLVWMELHNPLTPMSAGEQFSGRELATGPPVVGADDNMHGGHRALLSDSDSTGATWSIYRVHVTKLLNNAMVQNPNDRMGLWTPDNVDGTPNTGIMQTVVFHNSGTTQPPNSVVDPMAGLKVVQANVTAGFGPNGSFYLVGPELDQPGWTPGGGAGAARLGNNIANLTSKALQFGLQWTEVPNNPSNNGRPGTDANALWTPGLVLQRLACPSLPPGPNNPYITVDSWTSDPRAINDQLRLDNNGNRDPANAPGLDQTFAWGRRQPHDGFIDYNNGGAYRQGAGAAGQPGTTFGRHNGSTPPNAYPPATPPGNPTPGTLQYPFQPLVHLDRAVLNPAELLHVVATKPHLFTSFFRPAPGGRLAYTANWLDQPDGILQPGQSTFLFRAFDFLRPGTYVDGLPMAGRVPGRVNINTMPWVNPIPWGGYPEQKRVFEAITDRSPANRFTQGDVDNAYSSFFLDPNTGRSAVPPLPSLFPQGTIVTEGDRPYVGTGLAVSPAPPGTGPQYRTLYRPNGFYQPNAPEQLSTLPVGGRPSYAGSWEKYELLQKSVERLTTRSNTFAVYATIGYFEVKNPGPYTETNRPVLGKELGSDSGSITRHKFFSIVDRTNLSLEQPLPGATTLRQGQAPVYLQYEPEVLLPSPGITADPDTTDMTSVVIPATWYPGAPIVNRGAVMVRIPATTVSPTTAVGLPQPAWPPAGPVPTYSVSGNYDGTPWTLYDGSQIEIDFGGKKETVTVRLPFNALETVPIPPQYPGDIPTQTTTAKIILLSNSSLDPRRFDFAHHRGATMRIIAPDPKFAPSVPGNPGPQPGFNYKSARYASVVRYVEQTR